MKRRHLAVPHPLHITLATLLAFPIALSPAGCELVAGVDRSKIPTEAGGSDSIGGSTPGTGGSTSGAAGDTQDAGAGGTLQGSGGSTSGMGGKAQAGTGGDAQAGVGGDAQAGAGGDSQAGAGGDSPIGSGGSSASHGGAASGVAATGGTASGGAAAGGAAAGGAASGGAAAGGTASGGTASGGTAAGGTASGGAGGGASGKVIYVTSMPKKANFGGINGADTQCNADPPVPGTFKALLVDGSTRVACTSAQCTTNGATEGVDWVLAPNTKYVRADNTTVIGTTNSAGIFSFPLEASIGTSSLSYWTGLSADWTTSADSCAGWTQTSGAFANEGLADAVDSAAIIGVNESCATLAGAFFACVQQ